MTSITDHMAAFAAGMSYDQLPGDVAARTKLLFLDTVGIALRARHDAESTPSLLAAVEKLGLGQGAASVVGDSAGYAPPAAALINGTLAHSLDFDDTHAAGSIHASAPIVPAAIAAAEMAGRDGRALIAAIVAGYEVQIRLSMALVPKEHYERGYHPTATCGAFGAAAAAANLFGLSADGVANALGICLSQTSGSMQFLSDGAWTKRFQVGNAAMSGLVAASLAEAGFKGATDAIGGTYGFLRSYAPDPQFDKATDGLGEVYETMAIGVKPYPSCRMTHAAADGLIALRAEHGIAEDEIDSVEVGLSQTGITVVGAPEAEKQNPTSVVDGQFSMPFIAAAVLRDGGFGWDDYARHLADEKTRALCGRVRTVLDPAASAENPMGAVVRIETARGSFAKTVAYPKGEPEAFPTVDDLRAKFAGLVGPYLSDAGVDALAEAILSLDAATDIGAVMARTRGDRADGLRVAAGTR